MLAAFLSQTDSEITVIDRERQYEALIDRGLVFVDTAGKKTRFGNLHVSNRLGDQENFDVVFLAVKSHEIFNLVEDLAGLVDEHTVLVTLQNGIPSIRDEGPEPVLLAILRYFERGSFIYKRPYPCKVHCCRQCWACTSSVKLKNEHDIALRM